jgi:hypothetical protein
MRSNPPRSAKLDYDPNAPQGNSLIPVGNLLVVDEDSAILLQTLVWRSGSA